MCKHPGFISGLCYMCGLKVDVEKYDSVALTYVHQVIYMHPLHVHIGMIFCSAECFRLTWCVEELHTFDLLMFF